MRLRTIGNPLSENLIAALEGCGIKTDVDLLFSATPNAIWLKLPPDTIPLKEFRKVIEQVTERLAALSCVGSDMLQIEDAKLGTRNSVDLSCGVRELDELLGGFGSHRVLEISGDRGSGKTALVLSIVMQQLAHYPNTSATWLDTTGDISAERISSTLDSIGYEVGTETALQRLQITRAFDLSALQEALQELTLMLSLGQEANQPVVRTVVIDSVTPIFRPLLSAISAHGHSSMVTLMRQLRTLADQYSLTALVVNDTSTSFPNNPRSAFTFTTRKPALGPSFTYLSDTTLWLAKPKPENLIGVSEEGEAELHIAEILRSKLMPSRTWCSFRICAGQLIRG